MLQIESNLIIFGDSQIKEFVATHRKKPNTIFVEKDMDYFKNMWYTPKIKKCIDAARNNP